ncbi:hypothetical protein [Sulfuricurvum sp.]|uniref:hypothetical protein n=1 Tax=Sulfuricurvum sp. TaxID=2025608 RepID=UPI003C4DA655
MKNPFDPSTVVVGVSLFAIILTGGWALHQHSVLSEAAAQRDASIQTFERLSTLKGRWGDSPDIQQKRAYLMTHPALVRQEQRQKTLLLEYANLSKNEFDRIVGTLMNAPFVITKLALARNGDTGTISVEIER